MRCPWIFLALLVSATAPATAAETAEQHVEVTAQKPGARDEKTLAQLLNAQDAFDRHHALAPSATLAFRVYARLDPQDLPRLRVFLVDGDRRREVPLDDHQRFTLAPEWTRALADRGALLQTSLPDGAVAWKVDIRSPGVPDDRRRLGDLRLECEADTFHGNLQRGLRTPVSAVLDASDELCLLDDAEVWFAERPIFGVALVAGDRRRLLPYAYLHGSTGTMALAGLFDWAHALRDRAYFLPLEDRSWPDDTDVVFDLMDDPQPEPGAMRHLLALAACALGVGCSTVGNGRLVQLDAAQAQSLFVPGRTTRDDVRQTLGEGAVIRFQSGVETWHYLYRDGVAKGWDDVPYIGLITARLDRPTKELVILFDPAGVLRRWSLQTYRASGSAPG